ncbi:unnamed protein product [Arabidopsis thaliana]|uniref:Uncharacterized protein n=1 Tax=Arabidopsis thaliana TaxID=3702 RepID=A0A5S9XQ58_ARATH|nr:unnamed protein product [Arabidopsis thaliana]
MGVQLIFCVIQGSAEVVYMIKSDAIQAMRKYNNILGGSTEAAPVAARVNVTGLNGRMKRSVFIGQAVRGGRVGRGTCSGPVGRRLPIKSQALKFSKSEEFQTKISKSVRYRFVMDSKDFPEFGSIELESQRDIEAEIHRSRFEENKQRRFDGVETSKSRKRRTIDIEDDDDDVNDNDVKDDNDKGKTSAPEDPEPKKR